jgi:hypothetical protein
MSLKVPYRALALSSPSGATAASANTELTRDRRQFAIELTVTISRWRSLDGQKQPAAPIA